MSTTLKNGTTVEDPRLGRIYEEDWNSLNYLVTDHPRLAGLRANVVEKAPRSYTWRLTTWLDQMQEGACVSTGVGHELAAMPVKVAGVTFPWCRERIYWPAQVADEWPGGSYPGASPFYEGTSVLAGVKVAAALGYYTNYYWAIDLKQWALGVAYAGPAIGGFNWYEGMFNTDSDGFIHPTGPLVGGHCVCIVGIKIKWKTWLNRFTSRKWENVDLDRSYFTIHNSWGQDWGVNGRAKLSLRDAETLLNQQGEVAFGVRDPLLKVTI